MLILKFCICLLCILWIFLSIYKQFRPEGFRKNNDPFSLIPSWTLFSPKPMKNNCLLAYRERLVEGNISEIIVINDFTPKWYFIFWYGQRRDVKFILSIRRQLPSYKNVDKLFLKSTSFMMIKNYVLNYNTNQKQPTERQLLYFVKGGFYLNRTDKLLFVSKIKNT
ncbi:hypothetical protein SAMN05444407_101278 [Chryseobacterium contaminans]|uniref:Uncharacterized protein n=1 Tax=Chryseobacterium contaminans TaxID=1423959 RepID=A0A1M6VMG0_9FLAO|nr:hypothetical protein SAMN05444407_101278 [Chryseobacterium contaminans]